MSNHPCVGLIWCIPTAIFFRFVDSTKDFLFLLRREQRNQQISCFDTFSRIACRVSHIIVLCFAMAEATTDGTAADAATEVDEDDPSEVDEELDNIWQDKYVEVWKDAQGKDCWKCLHCNGICSGKNQPKVLAHLTGAKSRSASAGVSNALSVSV